MKHTPGPWRIDYDENASPHIWIDAETEFGVAKIESCDHGDGKETLNQEDWDNARLIAAAPELLAALKLAQVAILSLSRRIDIQNASGADIAALDQAERADLSATAAIARAERK